MIRKVGGEGIFSMAYQGIDAVWMRWFIPGGAMLSTEAEDTRQHAERLAELDQVRHH